MAALPAGPPHPLRAPRVTHTGRPGSDRFMLSDAIEHRCQPIDVSSTGAALRAPVRGELGERVICYLDQYGRVTGLITRLLEDGFAMAFDAPPGKRDRLALRVAWQASRPATETEPEGAPHVVPAQRRVVLGRARGARLVAQVVDLSPTGVTLLVAQPPSTGEAVTVGQHAGVVARVVQKLTVVVFDVPLPAGDLTPAIAL